jgi:ArsR family transcriptional regulator
MLDILEECCDPEAAQTAGQQLPTPEEAAHLAELFKALADPNRARIIGALAAAELCVHDLAMLVSMSQSAVSHQLRTLRALNLVSHRRKGRMVYYQLDDEHIHDLYTRALTHIQHG